MKRCIRYSICFPHGLVGRGSVVNNMYKTSYLQPDYAYCNAHGIDYQPVIFSGFAWSNLNSNKVNEIPRNKGTLLWQQVYNIKTMKIQSMYVAMFDEYDEGTAILKAADCYFAKPTNQYFLTTSADGTYLSSDFYLRLVGKATRVFKGLDQLTTNVTIPYSSGPNWFRTSVDVGTDATILIPDNVEYKSNVIGLGGVGSPRCFSQVYIRYPQGKKLPLSELKQVKRVTISKNKGEDVEFKIHVSELKKWNDDQNGLMLYKGSYHLYVGSNSGDYRLDGNFSIEN